MTGHLNDLDPTPTATVLAGMEMQPAAYTVIGQHTPFCRTDVAACGTADIQLAMGVGADVTAAEIRGALDEFVMAVHEWLDGRGRLPLAYVPSPDGHDAALDEYPRQDPSNA